MIHMTHMSRHRAEIQNFNYESLIYLFGPTDRSCERHKEVNKMIMSYGSILLGIRISTGKKKGFRWRGMTKEES